MMYCPNGFKKGSDGCDVCECEESQELKCANRPMCTMYCPHGFQKDKEGCDICECVNPDDEEHEEYPECVQLRCNKHCPGGFRTDSRKCNICECNDDYPIVTTPMQNSCSPIRCTMFCEHGFMRDQKGCEICKCAERPQSKCPKITCHMHCAEGFSRDDNGCEICKCHFSSNSASRCSKPQVGCRMSCPHGFKLDDEGCETCSCFWPDTMKTGGSDESTDGCNHAICYKHCDFGLRVDEKGCQLCECVVLTKDDKVDATVADSRRAPCSKEPHTGPCHASLTRWYFDPRAKTCQTFTYGGCRGNYNNFATEKACLKFCAPVVNHEKKEKQSRYMRVLGLH